MNVAGALLNGIWTPVAAGISCNVSTVSKKIRIFWLDMHILTMYTLSMPERSSKKPADLNALAKSIVDKATDEATAEELQAKAIEEGKNPAAVLLGRLGGLKGGKARAATLTAERRSEIAKLAAEKRWAKNR